jgi:hypothetical protein
MMDRQTDDVLNGSENSIDQQGDHLGRLGETGGSFTIRKLVPTLFIGLGGTGLNIIAPIRRRILHETWKGRSGATKVGSLEEFPVAEFMHFDLDQREMQGANISATTDPLADLVKLPSQDRVVTGLKLSKYCRSNDDLQKYKNIASWFPLTPDKARTLGIDTSKGAGQMRSISRLYFFDNYRQARDTIAAKLNHLKANRGNRHQMSRLGLEVEGLKVRIVVICSIAGGTGSGSFLDMGWLARHLAEKAFGDGNYEVQLILFTPRGYSMANKERTEANGYAALMELETCMRQFPEFVGTWSLEEGKRTLDPTPFTDVYLMETANMGHHALKDEDLPEVYEMVADVLFEDFANQDFADNKRSIAVNQSQHKELPHHPPIPDGYGELKLNYYMGYSSFGQSILDTQYTRQLDEQEYRWCAAMLEAFFCLSGQDTEAHRASDKQRDDFLIKHLGLTPTTFDRFPEFGNNKEGRNLCATFIDSHLTDDLLNDEHGGMEEAIQQKINASLEAIKIDEHNIAEWPKLLRQRIPALEQDAIRDADTKAETYEDRIGRRAAQILKEKEEIIRDRLYEYLDNQDYGGLEFVLTMIELIKAAFDHPNTGLVKILEENQKRYHAVRDALRTHQIESTLANISGAVGKTLFKKPDINKAKIYLDQLKKDLGYYLCFHVRGVAAQDAAALLKDLSGYLGTTKGMDEQGRLTHTGLIEEFQAGRREVLSVADEIRKTTDRIEDSANKSHANYILLPTEQPEMALPKEQELRKWANEVFKDIGSKKIFPMLQTTSGKNKLVALLHNKAADERSKMQTAETEWLDGDFSDVQLNADQFKCFLGVGKKDEWDPFLDELKSSLPTYAGITERQFQICTTGIPGRAVCYCELSGFPLCVLRGLENWRTSYRQESQERVLHTHIDPTLFVQPMVPTPLELKERSADFRLFLLAVALRILTRNPETTIPPGQYLFDFGRGDRRNFGNERSFRVHGLPPKHRDTIEQAVNDVLSSLSAIQLKALSILIGFMGRVTYAPKIIKQDTGSEDKVPGFSNAVALKLSEELSKSAAQLGLGNDKAKEVEDRLIDYDDEIGSLSRWTEAIANSSSDAYGWEVAAPDRQAPDRSKRRVVKQFFESGWIERLIGDQTFDPANIRPPEPPTAQGPPPPQPGVTPPSLATYFLSVNGKQFGPYQFQQLSEWVGSGQVAPTTLAWREGMAQWQALNTLPEFVAPTHMPGAAPPPPQPPGPPPLPKT